MEQLPGHRTGRETMLVRQVARRSFRVASKHLQNGQICRIKPAALYRRAVAGYGSRR